MALIDAAELQYTCIHYQPGVFGASGGAENDETPRRLAPLAPQLGREPTAKLWASRANRGPLSRKGLQSFHALAGLCCCPGQHSSLRPATGPTEPWPMSHPNQAPHAREFHYRPGHESVLPPSRPSQLDDPASRSGRRPKTKRRVSQLVYQNAIGIVRISAKEHA